MLTRHLCDQEDWKRDSGEEPALSYGAFCDALFELADIWVESTRVDHYAVFLGILRSHVEDPSSWGKDWSAFSSEDTPHFCEGRSPHGDWIGLGLCVSPQTGEFVPADAEDYEGDELNDLSDTGNPFHIRSYTEKCNADTHNAGVLIPFQNRRRTRSLLPQMATTPSQSTCGAN